MKKIGFIGVGNMGAAIINGWSSVEGVELHGADLNKEALQNLADTCGLIPQPDAAALAAACDYVILAVKPQHARPVLEQIAPALDAETCLLSIAAGITSEKLADWTGNKSPVVRIMPNTPALVGEGVYAICLEDEALSDEMKTFIPEVFAKIGQVHVLPEKQFDAYTGLIGSGPAYVFYFMEALIESGVTMGLTRDQSTQMVEALVSGSVKLAKESDLHVSQLREMVTSPGGTTIRALNHMDRMAVRSSISDAVIESYLRSIELGEG